MTSMAHDPKCIALKQLETALRLYFEQEDYYSVITLAGASEEIFGKLLNENARENSLDSLKKSVSGLFKHLYSEDLDEKEIVTRANDARNKLKHETGVCEFDAPEEAKDMLNRAIKNYYSLTHNPTPAMDRFQAMHVRDNAVVRDADDLATLRERGILP